jgi:hypothetical protein
MQELQSYALLDKAVQLQASKPLQVGSDFCHPLAIVAKCKARTKGPGDGEEGTVFGPMHMICYMGEV